MAEPSTTAGISLTVIAVALLGPMTGPYAVIFFSALAGAMWPLFSSTTDIKAGAWLLFRCTTTAIVLTVFIAGIMERLWAIPVNESLGSVALVIGALGNGWKQVFGAIAESLKLFVGRVGGKL